MFASDNIKKRITRFNKRLNQEGIKYLIFIITNQAGIAKGKFKLSDLLKLHKQLKNYLVKKKIFISDIQFCPYHPNGVVKIYKRKSGYRKPGNLMINNIFRNWDINKKKSIMIGDKKSDYLAAQKSMLKFYFAKNDFFKQIKTENLDVGIITKLVDHQYDSVAKILKLSRLIM